MVKEKRLEASEVIEPALIEENVPNIRGILEEIKGYHGVIGYILRNSKSATIDLDDPSRIIDYALISSSAMDAGKYVLESFKLGELKSVFVDGGSVKMLSLTVSDNKISVFMEKNADHERILKKLTSK